MNRLGFNSIEMDKYNLKKRTAFSVGKLGKFWLVWKILQDLSLKSKETKVNPHYSFKLLKEKTIVDFRDKYLEKCFCTAKILFLPAHESLSHKM